MISYARLTLVVACALAAFSSACVSVKQADCSQFRCTSSNCIQSGQLALEDGRPDEALCYFRSAMAADAANGEARLGYGTSLVILGRLSEARQEFQRVLASSPAPDNQNTARSWLAAIDSPLQIDFLYRFDEGCPPEVAASAYASGSLRRTLTRFGAFRSVSPVGDQVSRGREESGCEHARRHGAKVALLSTTRCGRTTYVTNPTALGGLVQFRGTLYTTHVALQVEIYQVNRCSRVDMLTAEGSSSGQGKLAIWLAAESGVGRLVLRLANELLYSPGPR